LVSHACREISDAVAEELGRRPSLNELCQVLVWGLREAGEDVISDVHPGRIEALTIQLRKAKTERIKPGDVVAVPGSEGK